MMLDAYDDIMTTEDACEALKMGPGALYEILNNGKLKAYRNGRFWRIPKEAVKQYIKESSRMK